MTKKVIVGFLIVLVLVGGLGAGVMLVKRQQDIRSKAASCNMRWPADPTTTCGTTTQSPAQGVSITTLTPNFHWDYGGYRDGENGLCVEPSGCSTYSVSIYLMEGSPTAKAFARADIPRGTTQTAPPKDASFADFYICDYGNVFPDDPATCHTDGQPNISALKHGTTYYWRVTPYYDGVVHAEQTWIYTFITPPVPEPPVCVSLTQDSTVTTISPGEVKNYTAVFSNNEGTTYNWDVTSSGINLGTLVPDGLKATWTAPSTISSDQTWTVSVTAVNSIGTSAIGNCLRTLTFTTTPTAACQLVESVPANLSNVKIGDSVTFNGWGTITSAPDVDSIDKIDFTILKDGVTFSQKTITTTLDVAKTTESLKYWVATTSAVITDSGSYSVQIKVHQKSSDDSTWLQ